MDFSGICKTKEIATGTGSAITVVTVMMFAVLLPGINASDQINERQDEEIKAVTLQVAQNNVPELKKLISDEFKDTNDKIDGNTKLILENYRLLCSITEGQC